MGDQTMKTIAVFDRSFRLPGFDETLPAGEYDIETELVSPPDHRDPDAWKAAVIVNLHPRMSHPGLTRSLSVSLVDLDQARAKDKLSGKDLSGIFLDEMLADPMVKLVMQADGVSEAQLRHLYSGSRTTRSDMDGRDAGITNERAQASLRDEPESRETGDERPPRRPRKSSGSE
ncbi:hypothetical protein [Cognatishimia sp. F0-27]|uniref:hypothetical protein n=1 Tax=Cognatishimia sp. F0-27 TaxID=2816855 RepID=UPI001D0BFFCE|nr:hypothetical protein [Cognatishimia sp. F0-27]